MSHAAQWKVSVELREENGRTTARADLETGGGAKTGDAHLTGRGTAQCAPDDADVPAIGDEFAAGRALRDLGNRLLEAAEKDVEAHGAAPEPRTSTPYAWPV
ncbi:dsRBD fold-containing protein [Streptomyces sp. NPDC049585]|uniref:dsRBD fold-containing protein n=1 Tax=Streptomyces sp. NPDC049585 TaxID=3155154 RepID=UPI003442EACA